MMGSSTYYLTIMWLLSLIFFFSLTLSDSSLLPLCHSKERYALLQFKNSFIITQPVSDTPFAYPKTASWNLGEGNGSDCCSWAGVECDEYTGHVIGLDLSASGLYGSINSSSSLFKLVHLQKLSLAQNNFNYSQIPPTFGNLSELVYLDLPNSSFYGQIPSEISLLSKLSYLDLSYNYNPFYGRLLQLRTPNLRSLIQNLTNLQHLHLVSVDIYSPIPDVLANLSSLTSLYLEDCRLQGEFPTEIFRLPNLQDLHMPHNPELFGHLPETWWSSKLQSLWLRNTSFSGHLPVAIGNSHSLEILDIGSCNFSGMIPSSLGNLSKLVVLELGANSFGGQIPASLSNLTQLTYASLYSNHFSNGTLSWLDKLTKLNFLYLKESNLSGEIPSSLAKLTKLVSLDFSANQFTGEIPSFFGNLMQLSFLDLSSNQLTGEVPSSMANLTQLSILKLAFNQLTGELPACLMNLTWLSYLHLGLNLFQGPIPVTISELKNLEYLILGSNNLNGTVELDTFFKLKNLKSLELRQNNLLLLIPKTNFNATYPKFTILGLASCNLSEVPDFLQNQNQLQYLDLSFNNIYQVPNWLWNLSTENLIYLDLSYNLLSSFLQPPAVLPWPNLLFFNLSSNKLHGSLPVPPVTIHSYSIFNNSLTGDLPPWICKLGLLHVLDLSNNRLHGLVPRCLGNISDSLSVLNLQNNNFHGTIPRTWTRRSQLRMISFSHNKLHGRIPRSLANCTMLEKLDVGNNRLNDTFPHWLGRLSELKILILQSNWLHGKIGCEHDSQFPKLRIIDVSSNNFTGKLPSDCFESWDTMKIGNSDHLRYMQADTSVDMGTYIWHDHYDYSTTVTNKGMKMQYAKIMETFTAIDLSCNRFEGVIPETIRNLKGLRSLNLSNNFLVGEIIPSISNLTELESLDFSQNKLSGHIPPQLTQLTFLVIFNLSHNNLTGPIPRGRQFETFEESSYVGNPGLCGYPLSKTCATGPASVPVEEQDSGWFPDFGWKVVMIGYGCGVVFGVVVGHFAVERKRDWFMRTFRVRQRGRGRRRRRSPRN